MLRLWPLTLLVACACTGSPQRPSTPAERTPTAGSVSRNNPGGDAENPTDAALMRLREEPIGIKDDKFLTLRPRFADAQHWKRVRLFGHPTRAAFRYGDDGYAVAVILYSEAEDDNPRACLDAVVGRAQRLASTFHIALGPMRREMREYPRGIEAVDIAELERERDRQLERLEERRQRFEKARTLAAERRTARLLRSGRLERVHATTSPAAETPQPSEAQLEAEAQREQARREHALRQAQHQMIAAAGTTAIPAVLTSGQFETLLNDDRYLAALVAYPSWTGTCLVQGFAVRVGSDPALAEEVVGRWLSEQAPQLKWRMELTERPAIKNR